MTLVARPWFVVVVSEKHQRATRIQCLRVRNRTGIFLTKFRIHGWRVKPKVSGAEETVVLEPDSTNQGMV